MFDGKEEEEEKKKPVKLECLVKQIVVFALLVVAMVRLKQLFKHIPLSLSLSHCALRETGKNDINNSAYQLYTRQRLVANSSCCTSLVFLPI